MTINTNTITGTAPGDDQFIITATNGIVWIAGDPEDCPLTADTTVIYVSNDGEVDMILSVRTLNVDVA